MAIYPKRSTGSLINSAMNQPINQQRFANSLNTGRDKQAVGAQNNMLGKLVSGERSRLLQMDEVGLNLATRRDKLAFNRQIFAKKHSMAARQAHEKRKSDKLAFNLGLVSTAASGFNAVSGFRNRKAAERRHNEYMTELRKGRRWNWIDYNDQTPFDGEE